MAQTSLVKVTSAFLAGIIVALGSAIIYVKVSEAPQTSHGVLQIPPASGLGPEKMETIPAARQVAVKTVPPPPAPVVAAPKHLVAKTVRKPVPIAHTKSKPVEIAQRQPTPVAPPPVFVPAPLPSKPPSPAVNETATLGAPPQADPSFVKAPPPPEPHRVTLEAGTLLAIRLGETLSTEHNYTGDTFRATLDSPVVIDGFIIAERGSKVLGKILSAQKPGKMEGRANLSLALTEINTTDGQRIEVETSAYAKQGASNAGENAAKMAGGAALGAIIGALGGGGKGAAIGAGVGGAAGTGAVLLGHGKPVILTAETPLSFELSRPTVITERLN